MTVQFFYGGAGCGKTFNLMGELTGRLRDVPLCEGQKVLALTFMHGSRLRLDDRLKSLDGLLGRYECSTVDSFAWRIVRRWRSLAIELGFRGIAEDDYERMNDAAASLLEDDVVCGWVARRFPILLIDEAQDLTAPRLRVIAALAKRLDVLAAADEFQCLDESLRPNPACAWLSQGDLVTELTEPQRTDVPELLKAAQDIRSGIAPTSGRLFSIQATPNPALAGAWLSNALSWHGGGRSVAILTPTAGVFAHGAIGWIGRNQTKQGSGPHDLQWERNGEESIIEYLKNLELPDTFDIPLITARLRAGNDSRVERDVMRWVDVQKRCRGRNDFTREELAAVVRASFKGRHRYAKSNGRMWSAMTVHGAKNREFDNVIILWPAATGGEADQKRRLLYNAVTRAKSRCLVLVQAKISLGQPPFA